MAERAPLALGGDEPFDERHLRLAEQEVVGELEEEEPRVEGDVIEERPRRRTRVAPTRRQRASEQLGLRVRGALGGGALGRRPTACSLSVLDL